MFYQRLKPSLIDRGRQYGTLGEDDGVQSVVPQKSRRRSFPLAELSGIGLPSELSSDRHDDTAELPSYVGEIGHT